jgi:radical SAM protein with 4Fe4S-binding SPASM domain
MTAYIFPDKSVRPCLSMNVSMGSLETDSFYDIWNNDRYRRYRREARRRGRFPACDRCTELFRF